MSRLSQDREEREAQLREYEHDLGSRSSRRSTTSTLNAPATTTTTASKITVGHVVLGVIGLVIAVRLLPFVFWWIVSAALSVLHILTGVAIIGGLGWLAYKWFTGKRRRI